MSNPIFNSPFGNQIQNNSNPWVNMINQVKSSSDPNATMQTILQANPQFQGVVNYINQNGGNAKAAFYNLAAQKGVDPNTILSQLKW